MLLIFPLSHEFKVATGVREAFAAAPVSAETVLHKAF